MEDKLAFRQIYGDSFKRAVVEEYLRTGCSVRLILKKYNICYKSAIVRWMKQLGYTDITGNFVKPNKFVLRPKEPIAPLSDAGGNEALLKRIKELEQRLEDEQLLREMYEKMIKAAEEQFKIDIRKKRNTR